MASSTTDEKKPITESFNHEPSPEKDGLCWRVPKRYILAVMAFLGFCNVYALRVNLSVAIVAMTRNTTIVINGTEITHREFDWSPQTQGLLLSSFFWGYIVTQIPGGWLAKRFGGKYLFGGGIFGTAILTIITPPIARMSVPLLIAIRVLEGLLEGVTYPCVHALWAQWAPSLERSKLVTFAFAGAYFGTVVSMPLSSIIADTLGWAWVFYIFGVIAVIWFLFWCLIVSESPAEHPCISTAELDYIQTSIGMTQQQTKNQPVPWKAIFLSGPVWGIMLAHFAENWGFYTMLTELPTFLHDIMQFDIYKAGFVAAIPYLIMCITVQLGGQLADLIRSRGILTTTATRKVFNTVAFLWQAIFLIVVAYTMTPTATVACVSLAVGLGGFAWAGFSVNHLDIAPQFASVLMGISNTAATIPGIISPTLTGHIVRDSTAAQWQIVFYIAAGIYVFGAIMFLLLSSGERQPWAEIQGGYEHHVNPAEEEESQVQAQSPQLDDEDGEESSE